MPVIVTVLKYLLHQRRVVARKSLGAGKVYGASDVVNEARGFLVPANQANSTVIGNRNVRKALERIAGTAFIDLIHAHINTGFELADLRFVRDDA